MSTMSAVLYLYNLSCLPGGAVPHQVRVNPYSIGGGGADLVKSARVRNNNNIRD